MSNPPPNGRPFLKGNLWFHHPTPHKRKLGGDFSGWRIQTEKKDSYWVQFSCWKGLLEEGSMIEIHSYAEQRHGDTLLIVVEDFLFVEQPKRTSAVDLWELSDVQRWEVLHAESPLPHHRFKLRATVASVSPMLTMDPREPFVLVQLESDKKYEATLVIKQHYLGIVPGVEIFVTASRQLWRAPQTTPEAPSHIFVAHVVHNVMEKTETKPQHLTGTITRVSTDDNGALESIWIGQQELFVALLPKLASFMLSLQVGAQVIVWNWIMVGNLWVATLRTSLELTKPADKIIQRVPVDIRFVNRDMNAAVQDYIARKQLGCHVKWFPERYWKTVRNPYSEFYQGRLKDFTFATLSSLKRRTMDEFTSLLSRECRSLGWYASCVWPEKDLVTGGVCGNGRLTSEDVKCLPLVAGPPKEKFEGLAILRISRVVMSCLCLGNYVECNGSTTFPTRAQLPVYDDRKQDHGPCCLYRSSTGLIYIIGWFIEAHQSSARSPTEHYSLDDCLNLVGDHKDSSTIETLVLRKSFQVARIRNGVHSGLSLTVTNLPSSLEGEVCQAQNEDIRLPVAVDEMRQSAIRRALAGLGVSVSGDQLTLALAWWSLASSPRTCTLTSGCWDEVADETKSNDYGVQLVFPRTCQVLDEKRSYVRFRCSSSQYYATVALPSNCSNHKNPQKLGFGIFNRRTALDFTGGTKRFLPGMVSARPRRSLKHDSLVPGALLFCPNVQTVSIGDLYRSMCLSLAGGKNRHSLSPSLVRMIDGAIVLSIGFCRAQAECSKCFSVLVSKTNKRYRSIHTSHGSTTTTQLKCPNKCDVQQYGRIKWECSGIMDDGTGQCKLYTERDLVWSLLCLSRNAIKDVEIGAWQSSEGIVFNATLPPSQSLKDAVMSARANAFYERHSRKSLPKKQLEKMVLSFMSYYSKGCYVLERHCRSFSPLPQSYLVRCKSISDSVRHLHHADMYLSVPSVGGGGALRSTPTYTLPSLKVNLVDLVSQRKTNNH